MIIRQQKQIDFSTADGQKLKQEFCTKHGLDPNNINIELRRNPADFFMQENEKGEKRLSASASKGIPYRYYDKDNIEIMFADNYIPAIGLEKAVITRSDKLKFRYAGSVIINDFDTAYFILEHPELQGSELNKIRRPKGEYQFYVFNPEKEAQEKVERQRMENKAINAIEAIVSLEQLKITARGFMIQDTERKKEIILREELMSMAKGNPKTFLDKLKTEEFKLTSLVYEAKEKGKIIYQPVERAWYLQVQTDEGKKETRDKIHVVTAGDKPEESLITWLQSVRSGDWKNQLTKILEEKEVVKETPIAFVPHDIIAPKVDNSAERAELEKKARSLGIMGAFPKDTEKLKKKIEIELAKLQPA